MGNQVVELGTECDELRKKVENLSNGGHPQPLSNEKFAAGVLLLENRLARIQIVLEIITQQGETKKP